MNPSLARVERTPHGETCLEWCTEAELHLDYTHAVKEIIPASDTPAFEQLHLVQDDILCNTTIARLFALFTQWRSLELHQLAELHGMAISSRANRSSVVESLVRHSCNNLCQPPLVLFTTLSRPRTSDRVMASDVTTLIEQTLHAAPETYMQVASEGLRESIIREWQEVVSTSNLEQGACAPCGRRCPRRDLTNVSPRAFDLTLLRNDALPPRTRPRSYAFDLYQRALLEPRGLANRWALDSVCMCPTCHRDIVVKGRMPRLSLANWLYYAREVLPPEVTTAFERSSQFDRLLVSRARASRISFRFTEQDTTEPSNLERIEAYESTVPGAQRYIKGNVLVMPQNTTHLNTVLPPPAAVIRDTVCAVFVGRNKPTKETIGGLSPVLVRRSTVETIIHFLIADNPYYAPDNDSFFGFSPTNLSQLFDPQNNHLDLAVPCAMEVGFIEDSDALRASTSDYTGRNDLGNVPYADQPLLMENVGYTCGDHSPVSYRDMKLGALAHCLNDGRFLRSQAGDTFVPDFHNPALLTWLFPHLDPWGIGGFHHPSRAIPVTMQEQLSYLLQSTDTAFQKDPDFAFVYFNILQKKAVCDSVHFRVKETEQRRIVDQLLSIDKVVLNRMIAKFEADKHHVPDTVEEAEILSIVNDVGAVLRDIPGTSGYKLNMRNEIRSLVNYHGTPAFFVTLNPSDVTHPLVRLFAGDRISLEDAAVGEEITEWRQRLMVAKNPGACAMFFHTMISNFISVILRYGRSDPGLFGTCAAYYGTVEAQARGTLHCHMLIWIKGHPSPQQMRDLMISDDEYQQRMFDWLESLIKCEPLGAREVTSVPSMGNPLGPRQSRRHRPYEHPGSTRLPQIKALLPSEFRDQYHVLVNRLLLDFNWHEHTETCWKYLRRGHPRTDANCRMRMDGTTRSATVLDPDTQSILLRRLHPWIASYNDLVIFLMQSNMDIKHIGSGEGAKALIYYVTDYITKASLPAHLGLAALVYAIQRTDAKYNDVPTWTQRENSGALTILVNSMLSRQEISHQQVMSYLVGGGDHYTSHRFRHLHFRSFERAVMRYWERSVGYEVSRETQSQMEQDGATLSTTSVNDGPRHLDLRPLDRLNQHMEESRRMDGHSSGNQPGSTATLVFADTVNRNTNGPGRPPDPQLGADVFVEESVTLALAPGTISALTQQQDYLLRPTSEPFASMSLYHYTGLTEKLTAAAESRRLHRQRQSDGEHNPRLGRPQEERGSFLPAHPQYSSHLVRKRVSWVIPLILNGSLPCHDSTPEEQDTRARTILILFVPWRNPGDLKHIHETWREAYERRHREIAPEHHTIILNMTVLTECKDAKDRTLALRRSEYDSSSTSGTLPDSSEVGPENVSTAASDLRTSGFPSGVELDLPETLQVRRPILREVDDLISVPARVALDRCFGSELPRANSESFGRATLLEEEDHSAVAAEHTMMNKLKRKRRPSPVPTSVPTIRPFRSVPLSRPPTIDIQQIRPRSSNGGPSSDADSDRVGRANLDLMGVVRQVALEFQLHRNAEQQRAFELVARHVCFGGRQLLMYIAGVGGTGKTYVVKAILRLFDVLGRRHQILVSAPTGAAAILIDGYTIHSLLMLPQKQDSNMNLQPLVALWSGVLYLIVDEVSMISATLMSEISLRLQHAKGTSGLSEDVPFGGVSVIFLGDFGQLKPVGGPSLYHYRLTNHPNLLNMQNVSGVDALKGVYLWRLVRTVVILRTNQRQSGDSEYAELLSRIREGNSGNAHRAGTADDFAVLQTRLIQNFDAEISSKFSNAPVIVGVKSVRDPLNDRILRHHARRINADVHLYHSRDRVARTAIDTVMRERLWDLPTSITGDTLGRLPLFPGMRVMVQENVAFACKVVNGAIGTVRDIRYTEEDGLRFVSVVYVEIPGAGRRFGPDHDDIIPIFPVSTSIKWTIKKKTATSPAQVLYFTRLQPPLLPAYVFTDYKAQGRSLDYAIVDPDSAMSMQGAYVMLSRVRTLAGLAVLHPFRPIKIEDRIPEDLRTELARLEIEDGNTRRAFAPMRFA